MGKYEIEIYNLRIRQFHFKSWVERIHLAIIVHGERIVLGNFNVWALVHPTYPSKKIAIYNHDYDHSRQANLNLCNQNFYLTLKISYELYKDIAINEQELRQIFKDLEIIIE